MINHKLVNAFKAQNSCRGNTAEVFHIEYSSLCFLLYFINKAQYAMLDWVSFFLLI